MFSEYRSICYVEYRGIFLVIRIYFFHTLHTWFLGYIIAATLQISERTTDFRRGDPWLSASSRADRTSCHMWKV